MQFYMLSVYTLYYDNVLCMNYVLMISSGSRLGYDSIDLISNYSDSKS